MMLNARPHDYVCAWRLLWGPLLSLSIVIAWISVSVAGTEDAAWRNHMEVSVSAYQRGDTDRALKELEAGLKLAEGFEPSDPRLVQTLLGLALIHYDQQDYDRAELVLKRALGLTQGREELRRAELATASNALGLVYMHTARFEEAEPLFLQARSDFEVLYGPEHARTAQVVGNLAGLYQSWGRLPESEALYREAVPLYEKAFGLRHSELGQLLESYSALLFLMGRTEDAEAMEQRALSISEGS